MLVSEIKTVGDLKATPYKFRSIKAEMRDNLIHLIQKKHNFAPEIIGYEDTVLPQIHHAILAEHDFILLGLRGQGKSKLLKALTRLLDEYIPVIADSEIYEDPYSPILKSSKEKLAKYQDELAIKWIHRDLRFIEKLATPDVSMADLIGDIDPIKASRNQFDFSNPDVIDFGLIPKANRCIFALNELADLQARIQVALFTIMEEKSVQIKGFPFQFNLDLSLVYTANPEDYTARGSIITPLKDRIDSQIITHYPMNRQIGKAISYQEMNGHCRQLMKSIPEYIIDIVEEIAIQGRKSEFIDQSSGVSARLSISAMENIIAAAELRSLKNQEVFNVRINDLYAAIPAITGKIELLYEGEQEGMITIAQGLISNAILSIFNEQFSSEDDSESDCDKIKIWFENHTLDISDDDSNSEYSAKLMAITALNDYLKAQKKEFNDIHLNATCKHFIIESMVMKNYLSKFKIHKHFSYTDMMNTLLD